MAYLMLLAWPIVSFVLFKRLRVELAIIWTILGGYLLLPPIRANFDLPLLPPLNKVLIPNILAILGVLLLARQRFPLWPHSWLVGLGMVVFVASSIPTVLTNGAPIIFRVGALPGLRLQDIISAAGTQAVLLIPFVLGRAFLASSRAQRDFLIALMVAGLAYSLFALMEVRLSPFLNTQTYGWFQHEFLQMIRYGGFRPLVFLQHAIWLAIFFMFALVAAVTLYRAEDTSRRPWLLAACLWLGAVLILCKTMGPILYALMAVPLVLLLPVHWRVIAALGLATIAVCYPLLRGAGLVPVDDIIAQVTAIDPARAHSLNYRFTNESMLLERASERPVFGWGGWGRGQVYDYDTAEALTISDGRWIIVFGTYGWVGFLAEFGLLTLPLVFLGWRIFRNGTAVLSPYAATLALLLGINLFDLLPNATLEPLTWLIAGAVLGAAEHMRVAIPKKTASARRRTVIGYDVWYPDGPPPEKPRSLI